MIDNFNVIKQYVLTLGGFEDSPKLDLQIQMIIDEALAYCYRCDVPEQMELPLSDVIVNQIKTNELLGVDVNNVSSYSEGDMSIVLRRQNSSIGDKKYNGKLEPFKRIIGVIQDVSQ